MINHSEIQRHRREISAWSRANIFNNFFWQAMSKLWENRDVR